MKADERNQETHVIMCSLQLRVWALHFGDKTQGKNAGKDEVLCLPGTPEYQEVRKKSCMFAPGSWGFPKCGIFPPHGMNIIGF